MPLQMPTKPETAANDAARGLTPRRFVKEVALDPGILFSVADVLLFAKTNPVGFIACLGATGLSAGLRTLHVANPAFMKNMPRLSAIAADDRTALRVSGLALLTVTGASIATGAMLPAAAGFLLAVGNFRLAQSLSDAMEARRLEKMKKAAQAPDADAPDAPAPAPGPAPAARAWPQRLRDIAVLSVKRPDLYISGGFACAGLMAGGAALFVLPVVAVSFGVSMRNIIRALPEHNGHPKLMSAGASAGFAGIGTLEGQGLIAAAHVLNMTVMAEAERQVTPGGWRRIGENIRQGLARALRLDRPKPPEPVAHPIPVPFDAHDLGEDLPPPLPEAGKLKQHFNIPVPEAEPKPLPAAPAAQNDNMSPPQSGNMPAPQNAAQTPPRKAAPPDAAPCLSRRR